MTFVILHRFCRELLAAGVEHSKLMEAADRLRKTLDERDPGSKDLDEILDLMDCLAGWCSPGDELKGPN